MRVPSRRRISSRAIDDAPFPREHHRETSGADILTSGSSYSPSLPILRQWPGLLRLSYPVTAAGPWRILTAFPVTQCSNSTVGSSFAWSGMGVKAIGVHPVARAAAARPQGTEQGTGNRGEQGTGNREQGTASRGGITVAGVPWPTGELGAGSRECGRLRACTKALGGAESVDHSGLPAPGSPVFAAAGRDAAVRSTCVIGAQPSFGQLASETGDREFAPSARGGDERPRWGGAQGRRRWRSESVGVNLAPLFVGQLGQ